VRWLVANRLGDFSGAAKLRFKSGEVALWEVKAKTPPVPKATAASASAPSYLTLFPNQVMLYQDWCPDFEGVLSSVWIDRGDFPWRSQPIYQSRKDGLILSSPVLPGSYFLQLSSGHSLAVKVLPGSTLSQLELESCVPSDDGSLGLALRNHGEGELRLHNVTFSILPQAGDGTYQGPASAHFQEVFTIAPKSQALVTLPACRPPKKGALNIESREESRLLPLDRASD
jgi:hypothetical protein